MSSQIINPRLQAYRSELDALLIQVQQLASDINHEELQHTTENLRRNITEPFLFVVVGEVKAGKSSFVNALLGAEVCATDIEPCTDSIQQIVYAAEPFVQQLEPNLRKIGRPVDILQNISIVDTPGTNTVIQEHQIVTERYIPNSDLTFFVLFAKNPYQKSAWDFLDFVSAEWRKKVVFILQQADLLKPEDLEKNVERVREYAHQKRIQSPTIFTTSAELELAGQSESSGFEPVRSYIRSMVSSGESYRIKLRSVSDTTRKIIENLSTDVRALQTQLDIDRETSATIQQKIQAGRKRSHYEIDTLAERLVARYDTIAARIKQEFRESLSVLTVVRRSFVGLFNKEESMQTWINDFKSHCEQTLKESLEEVSREGAQHFVDGIRQLLEGLTQDLNHLQSHQVQTSLISVKVLERRQEVIESVKAKVMTLLTDQGLVHTLSADAESMASEIVGGAFVAVTGMILKIVEFAVAEALLDAIGIAFAGIGLVVFAVGLVWQRDRIIRRFENALDNEKERFRIDVSTRLSEKLSIISEEVERTFLQFYEYVEREEQAVGPILERYKTVEAQAQALFNQMDGRLK
ncbi:dynamin family protein [Pseudanabaena sp. FACHB-2040]|uniref:dynamin family protein n=1 Tax=Pseudanabaena sp. FACHB-2040 TaxID=2692859 RepID=UPI00168836ED|nr:dynamin family protein [Pseudanabaena sp. FACHB-2040]MBD2255961.1 dynamin family protein [Pseudanabaena sp. FACHB-2040]